MKSIFATLLIFVIAFALVQFGVLDIISSNYFFYLSWGLLIVVFICALIFVGLPHFEFVREFIKLYINDNDDVADKNNQKSQTKKASNKTSSKKINGEKKHEKK